MGNFKQYDKVRIKNTNQEIWYILSNSIEPASNNRFKVVPNKYIIKTLDSLAEFPVQEHDANNLELVEAFEMTEEGKAFHAKNLRGFLEDPNL